MEEKYCIPIYKKYTFSIVFKERKKKCLFYIYRRNTGQRLKSFYIYIRKEINLGKI